MPITRTVVAVCDDCGATDQASHATRLWGQGWRRHPNGRIVCKTCPRKRPGPKSRNDQREILAAYLEGKTLEEVASTLGISRECVRQILRAFPAYHAERERRLAATAERNAQSTAERRAYATQRRQRYRRRIDAAFDGITDALGRPPTSTDLQRSTVNTWLYAAIRKTYGGMDAYRRVRGIIPQLQKPGPKCK